MVEVYPVRSRQQVIDLFLGTRELLVASPPLTGGIHPCSSYLPTSSRNTLLPTKCPNARCFRFLHPFSPRHATRTQQMPDGPGDRPAEGDRAAVPADHRRGLRGAIAQVLADGKCCCYCTVSQPNLESYDAHLRRAHSLSSLPSPSLNCTLS